MRSMYFLKNLSSRLAIQLLYMAVSFATRTVFIWCLSEEYLGISGLFASILTVLGLAELGIGSSIVFAMYKPVAEEDREKLKTLMDFYRRAYRLVGFVLLAAGAAVLPVLPYLAKGSTDLVDLRLVFFLTVLEQAFSYWFYAYKSAILTATQKGYLTTDIILGITLLKAILQISVLVLLRGRPALSYYVYIAVGLLVNMLQNLLVKRRVDREFPFLREKNIVPLPREERQSILKNVVGMTTNRVCQVMNDGIDSTIISALVGLAATGFYSNYLTLKAMVTKCLNMVFSSLHSSVGNLCAVETPERKEEFLKVLHFVYFWLYGFCSICLVNLLSPFIAGVWLRDARWLLPKSVEFLLVFNFLMEGLAGAVVKYRDVHGLFWQVRYRYIFSSVLNMALSLLLVGPLRLGVTGALLGTTVSLAVMLSYDPILVYREVFHKGAGEFYRMYLRDMVLVLLTGGLVYAACLPFSAYTVENFFARLGLCLVIPNGLWYILFRRDPRFAYLRDMALGLIRRIPGMKRK